MGPLPKVAAKPAKGATNAKTTTNTKITTQQTKLPTIKSPIKTAEEIKGCSSIEEWVWGVHLVR